MSDHHPECERDEDCADYECGRCEACSFDFKDPNRLASYVHRGESGSINLCEICESTGVGTACMMMHKADDYRTLQTIAYLGNKILQKLEKEWTR